MALQGILYNQVYSTVWASWAGMMKIRACSTFEVYAVET